MIKLCGFAVSNYYNKVKLALLEKGIPFTEETVYPSQDPALLQRTPFGKVPFIETERGPLSESQVIVEYLDETYPAVRLLPTDPYEKAKCRELIQHLETNVEQAARRTYGAAFFGKSLNAETKEEVKILLDRGVNALGKRLQFAPYAFGGTFGAADCSVWVHLALISMAVQKIYGEDLLARIPGAKAYMQRIEQRPHVAKVKADRDAAIAALFANR